ncbi:MAG: D-aminoacyl-tRNA deacylase [bacterium]
MIALLQRVSRATVSVDSRTISNINEGLLILLGIRKGDTADQANRLADRCVNLRIFEDSNGKFNFSLKDISGEALVVSQFTLLADTTRGRRPSFSDAEEPAKSKELYELFIKAINKSGVQARGGIFGARMLVSLDNNGPVTITVEE